MAYFCDRETTAMHHTSPTRGSERRHIASGGIEIKSMHLCFASYFVGRLYSTLRKKGREKKHGSYNLWSHMFLPKKEEVAVLGYGNSSLSLSPLSTLHHLGSNGTEVHSSCFGSQVAVTHTPCLAGSSVDVLCQSSTSPAPCVNSANCPGMS